MLTALARVMLASRVLLALFCLGLLAGLSLYLARFAMKLWKLFLGLGELADDDLLIALLHLVDATLIASLVVIVALTTFDSMVARLQTDEEGDDLRWVSRSDLSNLKTKVATAIVAISSIHLLQVFMKIDSYREGTVLWLMVIHVVFIIGAVLLSLVDAYGRKAKG
jgi:uncharacterized protein (TIGR00645 family)